LLKWFFVDLAWRKLIIEDSETLFLLAIVLAVVEFALKAIA
jgi:hypothetical protein